MAPDRRSAETEASALCSAAQLSARARVVHLCPYAAPTPAHQSPGPTLPSFSTPLLRPLLHSVTPPLCMSPRLSALEQTVTCHLSSPGLRLHARPFATLIPCARDKPSLSDESAAALPLSVFTSQLPSAGSTSANVQRPSRGLRSE